MKRILLTLTVVTASYCSYAQSPIYTTAGYGVNYSTNGAYLGWNISGGGGETNFVNSIGGGWMGGFTFDNVTSSNVITRLMTISSNGNVGIGTTVPIGKLDVRGNIFIGTNDLSIGSAGSFVQIDQGANTGNTYTQIRAFSNGGSVTNNLVLQNSGGNVGIGTATPDALLAVKGTIHSKEVKVDLNFSAPDYVFESDYTLITLNELKAYLDKNHHLPEIPSADQMAKDGLSLGEMNTKLLKKVEELTLYLIEQQQTNQSQQEQINKLSQQLETITKILNKK